MRVSRLAQLTMISMFLAEEAGFFRVAARGAEFRFFNW
jgi:hypothetical protein